MNRITVEKLNNLIAEYKDDEEMLGNIYSALNGFEKYHGAVFEMETRSKVYTADVLGADEFRNRYSEMDRMRTKLHNAVISDVSLLNRMSELAGLPPFYEGEVSTQKGIRREVANAVFEFVEEIIKNRV